MTTGQLTTFAQMLKHHRRAAGLSQAALAERAQLSRDGISALERGRSHIPRRDTVQLLANALGLPPDEYAQLLASAQMYRPLMSSGESVPQSTPFPALPMPLTPLVGRDREIEAVCHLLHDENVRLVTLTGPPGVGKTCLAIHIARSLVGAFLNGVVFVDLASIREPDLAVSTIARAMNLRDAPEHMVPERLTSSLGTRSLLLVLDNFEHIITAAPTVVELLSACPRWKVLVTSRAVLRVRGEHEFPVPPLQYPLAADESVEDIGRSAAVTLFVHRAAEVQPDFALTQASAPVIAEICRQLDGLPLAIELAAVRIKLLPPATLLDRLTPMLPMLTGGQQDLPERQHTMRRAIAWSYDLLDARLQQCFRSFAILAGGWTLGAAERVCDMAPDASMSVLDALSALMDQSLVVRTAANGQEPCFRMLAMLREFGLERLEESGELDVVARRHAQYYAELAEAMGQDPGSSRPLPLHFCREDERGNLQTALDWALEHSEYDIAAHLAESSRAALAAKVC